ncbi:HmuY family protein [Flavobacterium branchiicola]|uniref:HmuY family protein n=1 Tax=Flavobacterium branchiicola TaxID=1114875 RepID=A0ABV9PHE9_9FLAO|nr:HmuY family protein [Flavobacterium branchiicola]MBS7255538.1 HmuY family protein [Flavobacterium branchiicola]
MKKNFILMLAFVLLAFTACNSDDDVVQVNAVAFAATSLNLTAKTTPIEVKFASPTAAAGSLTISFVETAVASGTDFSTLPAATGKTIVVPFEKNVSSVSFSFTKLKEAIEGEVKNVVFTISSATINTVISENKSIQVNFNETASLGTALAAEVGGPLQPNQVYVDLSSGKMTTAVRNSWDLGFYSGADFRVVLNSSVKMSAKQLETTNIDEAQIEDATMIIGQGSGIGSQIDDPTGDILKTTIAEVSATEGNNKVYLIYLGNKTADANPVLGKEGAVGGAARGWKKIRVLRSGNDYKVQYADIAATTHKEIVITKNAAYNFTFFSLLEDKVVNVEPQKAQWDINFTTFTNIIPGGTTPYFYPDFILNNTKGGAQTYQVLVTATTTYDNFTLANVEAAKFTADQRNIGSNWRGTTGGVDAAGNPISQFVLKTDRFYVVKDPAGNVYKLKFTGGAKADLERGHPTFQYAILK